MRYFIEYEEGIPVAQGWHKDDIIPLTREVSRDEFIEITGIIPPEEVVH